jgi:phenylalanyl-tRNA synthetase beta chain
MCGLLENVKYNQNRQNTTLKLFEFGKTYNKVNSKYNESRQLAFVLVGNKKPESWKYDNESVDFYDIKGICSSIKDKLGLHLIEKEAEKSPYFESSQVLLFKKQTVFEYGEVSDEIKRIIGFKGKIFMGIMNLEHVLALKDNSRISFKELPKTFFVKRDFSLILDKEVTYQSIEKIAKDCEKTLLKTVNLFDVYEGNNLPKNKKSYAVSFTFQNELETLKDAHIDKIMERIRTRLNKELGAELRV